MNKRQKLKKENAWFDSFQENRISSVRNNPYKLYDKKYRQGKKLRISIMVNNLIKELNSLVTD